MKGLVLLTCLLISATANALSIPDYEEAKKKGGDAFEVIKFYVTGIGHGFQIFNEMLEKSKQPKHYCPPPNINLNMNNYIDIVDAGIAEMKTYSKATGTPISEYSTIDMVLYFEIAKSFPCK